MATGGVTQSLGEKAAESAHRPARAVHQCGCHLSVGLAQKHLGLAQHFKSTHDWSPIGLDQKWSVSGIARHLRGLAGRTRCPLIMQAPAAARPSASKRSGYWLYEPVCCMRVACESPGSVLAALATGAMAAVMLRAAKAARIMFFIGILHL